MKVTSPLVSKSVVDALYLRADQLERRWANAGLAVDFRDRMIDAAWRFIDRHPLPDLHPRGAARLLTSFWTQSARRDAGRASTSSRVISLTDLDLPAPMAEFEEDSSVVKRSRDLLLQSGFRAEIAEAFLQHALLDVPSEVISEVRNRCDYQLTPDTLRQWKHRHFGRAAEVLRQNAARLGLNPGDCHGTSGDLALDNQEHDPTADPDRFSPLGATT